VVEHSPNAGANGAFSATLSLLHSGLTAPVITPTQKTTDGFMYQPETRSTRTPHPVWFYI